MFRYNYVYENAYAKNKKTVFNILVRNTFATLFRLLSFHLNLPLGCIFLFYCCVTNNPSFNLVKQQSFYYVNGFCGSGIRRAFIEHGWSLLMMFGTLTGNL